MLIERKLEQILQKTKKSILLLGPRQTGKSTLIRNLEPDLIINLSDEELYLKYLRDPALLKNSIGKNRKILIDEIQRIPSLLNTTQALLDERKNIQFLLTGSSARKLRRGKANLLPGRIISYELGPLTIQELGEQFELQKALQIGLLPGIYTEDDVSVAKRILKTYSLTYLKEEIQAEALTKNIEGFSRFFEVITSRCGDFIDFSKFSSQAMIERTTAKRYFEILTDTLIVNPVLPFAKSSKRRLIQHPKYYLFDVGVLNACQENHIVSPDRIGILFEHLVLQLILSSAKAYDQSIRVSVYRTEAGAEVDFIIEREREVFALEVKATKNIGRHDLSGLKSFSDYYKKDHKKMVVYLGDRNLEMDGIQICNLNSAMKFLDYL